MALSLLLALFFAAQDKPPEKCTLSGSAVSAVSGEALNRVEIFAEPEDGGPAATTMTDGKGNFALVNLDAGEYKLKGRRNGYLDTYFGARRAAGGGTIIAIEPGAEMKDVRVKLVPFAVLAGTVRETDGEPLAGVLVTVFGVTYLNRQRSFEQIIEVNTDDLGQYRIANLRPGKYYLRARPHGSDELNPSTEDHSRKTALPEVLLPALYPGVTDPTEARPVEIAAGAHVGGIDIALPRSRVVSVSGHLTVPPGTNGSIGLGAAPGFDLIGQYHSGDVNSNGDFEIDGVPPGSYTLAASAAPPRKYGSFLDMSRVLRASMPLAVGDGDVGGVHIAVAQGAEVAGRIVVEGNDPVKATNGFVQFTDASGFGSETPISEELTFTSLLSPGKYRVALSFALPGVVIKSIRAGQTDVMRDGLTVSEPAKISLEIVLAHDGGQIEGVVLDSADKPVAGATVLLVPAAPYGSIEDLATNQYGHYSFENIAPGDYTIFAWDDIEPGAWFDPDFLRSIEPHGQAVKLDAKGHETAQIHILGAK